MIVARWIVAVIILICGGQLTGWATETLTNADVVAMIEAQLDGALVRKKIKSCDNDFDISAGAMIALRKSNVPDGVIRTMLEAAEKQAKQRQNRIKMQIQYLTSSQAQTRHAAYLALLRMGGGARRAMVSLLTSDAEAQRRAAVALALGKMNVQEAIPALRLLIEDPAVEVRQASAEALYQLSAKEALSLAKKALSGWMPRVGDQPLDGYLRVVGLAREQAASAVVLRILEESEQEDARREAILCLGRLQRKEARKALERVLKSALKAETRSAAATALGRIQDSQSLSALEHAAKTDKGCRAACYLALSQFPTETVAPFLISQLGEGRPLKEQKALETALRRATRQNYGADKVAWLNWWERYEEAQAIEQVRKGGK